MISISRTFIPNVSINNEISLWREQNVTLCCHLSCGWTVSLLICTLRVNVDNTWFLINDTRNLRQQNLQCSSKNMTVPYILIYKNRSNFLVTSTKSLNDTAGFSSTPDLISERAETMTRQWFSCRFRRKKNNWAIDRIKRKPI